MYECQQEGVLSNENKLTTNASSISVMRTSHCDILSPLCFLCNRILPPEKMELDPILNPRGNFENPGKLG